MHGASLRARLESGPLPVRPAIDYARQAADGLATASPVFEQYDLHGDRFLVLRPSKDSAPPTVAIVSNWTSALPRAGTAGAP